MLQREWDDKEYELKSHISDKFRDIQMQANSLKNVEDEVKVSQALIKISDFIDEIRNAYSDLTDLYHQDIDPEPEDEYNGMNVLGL